MENRMQHMRLFPFIAAWLLFPCLLMAQTIAWACRGIGTLILETCGQAAKSAGFQSFGMGATLTGVKLFHARGYAAQVNLQIPLPNGELLPVVRMSKQA
jgi:hypothetical protein